MLLVDFLCAGFWADLTADKRIRTYVNPSPGCWALWAPGGSRQSRVWPLLEKQVGLLPKPAPEINSKSHSCVLRVSWDRHRTDNSSIYKFEAPARLPSCFGLSWLVLGLGIRRFVQAPCPPRSAPRSSLIPSFCVDPLLQPLLVGHLVLNIWVASSSRGFVPLARRSPPPVGPTRLASSPSSQSRAVGLV